MSEYNRTQKALLGTLVSFAGIVISFISSLLITMRVIVYLGSDFNGLNATVSQVLIVLGLVEGGFTTASLVALYKPYADNDQNLINKILSATQNKFRKIGMLTFLFGVIISIIYSFFIKTSIDYWTILLVFLMSVTSTAFNIFFISKFRLMYQVSQNDYIVGLINLVTSILMLFITLLVLEKTRSILLLRLVTLIFSIITGLLTAKLAKRKFKSISFHENHTNITIHGTKDVFIGKITDLIYTSASILFISTFVGTTQTSVYAVYNNIITLIIGLIFAVISSPANALGQIIGEDNQERLKSLFNEYEYDVILITSIMLSVTFVMMLPFVRLFTSQVTDADYIQPWLSLILVMIPFFQMIHIPSGLLINYSGHFKAVRKIQTAMCIVLTVSSLIGAFIFALYGILLAKLLSNFVLVGLEVGYARKKLLKCNFNSFFRNTVPNFIFASFLASIEYYFIKDIEVSWLIFFLLGFSCLLINTMLIGIFNSIIYKEEVRNIRTRIEVILRPIVNRHK